MELSKVVCTNFGLKLNGKLPGFPSCPSLFMASESTKRQDVFESFVEYKNALSAAFFPGKLHPTSSSPEKLVISEIFPGELEQN